jgi:hypothetical protein
MEVKDKHANIIMVACVIAALALILPPPHLYKLMYLEGYMVYLLGVCSGVFLSMLWIKALGWHKKGST